jgi:hypothetical protein
MGREAWDELRRGVFLENAYHCYACGTHTSDAWRHQWLEGHEAYTYDVQTQIAELDRVVGLCHRCHCFIHAAILQGDLDYSTDDILYVLHTGFDLLANADLLSEANADSWAMLGLFDRDLYEKLLPSTDVVQYGLPQEGWILRWDGFLWKRVLNSTFVKPDNPESPWRFAKVNDKGGLSYEL